MKKTVIKILIFIILFNYIFTQITFITAEETVDNTTGGLYTKEDFEQADNYGTTQGPNGQTYNNDFGTNDSTAGAVAGTIAQFINFIPLLFNKIINSMANEGGFINFNTELEDSEGKKYITEDDFKFITIEKILFGKYYLLNADVFKDSKDQKVTNQSGNDPESSTTPLVETLDDLRSEVSKWYYVTRLISLIIGLITLIYIGIKMAVSTVADEQSKYKKMLWSWVQSILIIVILPYIMNLLNFVAKILMDIINAFRDAMINNNQNSFETTIIETIYGDLESSGGFVFVSKVITFAILMWAEFKFFMMYIKRLLAVSFLTIISPLITITYSIDKAGDGRAQAFEGWLREYLMNILIQPLQAILYLIFVFSANSIAANTPLVGIIFLLSLTRAEKIVKTIFNMRELVSLHTMRLFKKDK